MARLTNMKVSATQRVIVFGAPKSGKSLLAAKLAEYFNLIWVDMENGYETLFQLPSEWQERVEVISLPDTRGYPIAIETCLKMIKGKVDICEEHGKVSCMLCRKELELFKKAGHERADANEAFNLFTRVDLPSTPADTIVVFDSFTQLSSSAIAHITKGKPDDYKLDYDDWGNLGKLLDIFLSHLQQANYNVVVISHEVESETEGKKKVLVPVGGTRNFSRNIAKYFGHVIYAERKNRKHVFSSSTSYSTTILTGSRTGIILEQDKDSTVEASLLQIFKPELYKTNSLVIESASKPTIKPVIKTITKEPTGGVAANSVLAKLKAKLNK